MTGRRDPAYRFGGLNVSVEGPPDPYFAEADQHAIPDVVVRMGRLTTEGPWDRVGRVSIDDDHLIVERGPLGYRMSWPEWFDALVYEEGRSVVVQTHAAWPRLTRTLLTTVLPIVLGYWGRVTLHASAVEIEGSAVVMAGESGTGKSTLATALGLRGARLLADDVAVLRFDGQGRVVVDPTSRATRLFPPTADGFGLRGAASPNEVKELVGRPDLDRAPDGVPVGAFIRLKPGADGVHHLRGADAAVEVLQLMPEAVDLRHDWQALRVDVATAIVGQGGVRRLAWAPSAGAALRLAESVAGEWAGGRQVPWSSRSLPSGSSDVSGGRLTC